MKVWGVAFLTCLCSLAIVKANESGKPDFASFDKDVLVILCENQYNEIQRLREDIEDLKSQIAGEHGGSEATIVGDVTSIPDGSWQVTINSVIEPNIDSYQAEIDDLRARLDGQIVQGTYRRPGHQTDGVEDRLREAEQDLQELMKRGKYKNRVSSDGNTIASSSNLRGYTASELADAKAAVRRLRGEKNGIDRRISELQRRIDVERNSVTAQGITDDGTPVTIEAPGVYGVVGKSLQEGNTYLITGRGVFSETSGKITLKTATLQQDAPAEVGM